MLNKVRANLQEMMDEGLIHIIRPRDEYEDEVNMVCGYPTEFQIFDINYMDDDLVQLHATFYHMDGQEVHHYESYQIRCGDCCGCSLVRRGVQLLLDNCTIRFTGNKDDYNGVNVIEDYSVEAMSDDEYVSAYEFFSSDESMFYDNIVIPEYSEEVGVNLIVPYFVTWMAKRYIIIGLVGSAVGILVVVLL